MPPCSVISYKFLQCELGQSRQIEVLFDRALDLLAQRFGFCVFCALSLQLLGGMDGSSPLDVLLPCCPYCDLLA
jgi:hypothetical protein